MPEVVEADVFTFGVFQNEGQSFSDGSGVSGGILADRGGEHPAGGCGFFIFLEDIQDRRRKNDAPAGGFGFGLGDQQLTFYPVNLPLNSQLSRGNFLPPSFILGVDF